ncbi:hypothetical protein [Leptospira yasudae]|uniref:Uncharacterized protein n=1 Tax=Leptospira yasudae TaxID=2202201 RepID=A0ABX9M1D5_9LEPT|nr:hypothetical protein [Leptospira yasudae]RHX78782.1 hypothetical protein DLM77_17130 [Leptospira yasudae]
MLDYLIWELPFDYEISYSEIDVATLIQAFVTVASSFSGAFFAYYFMNKHSVREKEMTRFLEHIDALLRIESYLVTNMEINQRNIDRLNYYKKANADSKIPVLDYDGYFVKWEIIDNVKTELLINKITSLLNELSVTDNMLKSFVKDSIERIEDSFTREGSVRISDSHTIEEFHKYLKDYIEDIGKNLIAFQNNLTEGLAIVQVAKDSHIKQYTEKYKNKPMSIDLGKDWFAEVQKKTDLIHKKMNSLL